jgi:hypothetical protein
MKTKEEIFYETKSAHDSFNVNKKMTTEENMKIIYQAMEEYADQFRTPAVSLPSEEEIAKKIDLYLRQNRYGLFGAARQIWLDAVDYVLSEIKRRTTK